MKSAGDVVNVFPKRVRERERPSVQRCSLRTFSSRRYAMIWWIPPQSQSPGPRVKRQNWPGRVEAGSPGQSWGTGG